MTKEREDALLDNPAPAQSYSTPTANVRRLGPLLYSIEIRNDRWPTGFCELRRDLSSASQFIRECGCSDAGLFEHDFDKGDWKEGA